MSNHSFNTVASTIFVLVIVIDLVISWEPENESKDSISYLNDGAESSAETFWDDVRGSEYVTKLNSSDFNKFSGEHSETFIMFYANWCKYSVQAKGEFANAAQEIAYTEGFSNVHFGALDCNSTIENKKICNKSFNVTKYPRFLYFQNGRLKRMYTLHCPRYTEFFYNWIVYKGDEKFCSGSSSLSITTSTAGLSSVMQVSYLMSFCVTVLLYGIRNKIQSV